MRMRVMMILLAFAFFAMPLVSSSIFIEPLNAIYNQGDQINVQTTIVPPIATSAHYTVDLKCGTQYSSNIFNSFFSIQAGIEKQVIISTELVDPLLEQVTEECHLSATFGSEQVNSNSFRLSKLILVNADLEVSSLNPSDNFHLTGTAVKESGIAVNGFVELFIPAMNLYKSSVVIDGVFDLSITLPQNSKSGEHEFRLEVHNTDYNSRKINFGNYSDKMSVSQILKEVNIHLAGETAQPESEFLFRVDAIDQAGDSMIKDVSLVVNQPKGVPYIKKVVKSGEDQKINFLLSDIPGYWSIETDVDGVTSRKLFYLSEVSSLQTSLIDNTIIVTNIGNAAYSGPLEVVIGSVVEVKQIKLGPGETQKFTLRAPDGDYSISISDQAGESTTLGSAFLTGNAIKVTDFREDVIYTFTNPIIWWLGVALLILIIVLVQVKIRMQRMPSRMPMSSPTPMSNPVNTFKPSKVEFTPNTRSGLDMSDNKKFDMSWFNKPKVAAPVSSAPFSSSPKVNPANLFGTEGQGIRERAAAIALYVSANSPAVAETMNRALSIAQETGAKVYIDGDYKIVLFSPRLTKSQDNESNAVNVARRMQALFLEHMSVNTMVTNFGIGVSDGEIISEIEGNKFHFTSTGNLISYAKRLAHASSTKLFISDSIRRKLISSVKAEKSPFQGVWEVMRVIDYSQSRDFIKRFSDRNN